MRFSALTAVLLSIALTQPAAAGRACGVERWWVKTGIDPDAQRVDVAHPKAASIAELVALPAPASIPERSRLEPAELTVFVVTGTLVAYKLEDDSDVHLILHDDEGRELLAELPWTECVGESSPFAALIASAGEVFDSRFELTHSWRRTRLPVRVMGVGFFDFPHGQRGATNSFELHPVLRIEFL
jgi:hypothetical protein